MKTIKLLKSLIKDTNATHMNLSNVKGYLGELIVKEKLEKEGYEVMQKGNQSGYDLDVPSLSAKIDVKFSTFKSEAKNYPKYWGWALMSGSKNRELKFSHFVLVALRENLDLDAYYVIRIRDLKFFPKNFAQFRNVKKGFGVFPKDLPKNATKNDKKYARESKKLLKTKKVIKVLPRQNLSKILNKK